VNIPLNIDFQQILLHLFNFSILSFGLYLLLFKPVQSFMEKREHTYLDMHHKAETELKEAEELKAAYEKHLETVEAEVEEYKKKAMEEAEREADELLQSTKQQAAQIITEAKKAAQKEREKILESAQKEIASMVMDAAEKLLSSSTSEALDRFLYSVKKE
jgi:F-type H+-transporting ATPase subunit b